MNVNIHPSWKEKLNSEFQKPYFKQLTDFVRGEYQNNTCYPPGSKVFSAFDLCPLESLKVVIIGQDPYHGYGQANGLCFSVAEGITHPPSLINIFKELESDLNIPYPSSGNLERWAAQGVLLLNATLTVREQQPGSHQKKGWEVFTDQVIKLISDECTNIVFLLWGGYAKKKIKLINTDNHVVLTSGHPSPLSANRGYWFGNKHFSRANVELNARNIEEIKW